MDLTDLPIDIIRDGASVGFWLTLTYALLRYAVGQADKRCTVAESREERCATSLARQIEVSSALTDEVKAALGELRGTK
jgi:hypothetical protein